MSTTNQTVVTVSPKALKVINMVKAAIAASPTGVTFFSINNYTNKQGEVANHVFNIGASYEKAKQADIKFLQELDLTKGQWNSSMINMELARTKLIEAFLKPDQAKSEAQQDAYTIITKGVKVHNETGQLYIYGNRVNKTIIEAGEYQQKNQQALTIAKDELRKLLKTGKFRQFIVAECETIKGNGETIEIG